MLSNRIALTALGLLGAAAVTAPAAAADGATATLIDPAGQEIGQVRLTTLAAGGVHIVATAHSLSAGVHAFHIHAIGNCDPATGFKSAGGHYGLPGQLHGWETEGGPHVGDLPNVHVQDDGVLAVEYFHTLVSLDEDAEATVFDADGSAIVIHAGPDDYRSQPSGAAGARIACGVIVAD